MKFLIMLILGLTMFAATTFWECNYCRQQYHGQYPPRQAKCPARDMKHTHWWIGKN